MKGVTLRDGVVAVIGGVPPAAETVEVRRYPGEFDPWAQRVVLVRQVVAVPVEFYVEQHERGMMPTRRQQIEILHRWLECNPELPPVRKVPR